MGYFIAFNRECIFFFLQIEALFVVTLPEAIYWHHFSNSICSFNVSMSHLGSSQDISNIFMTNIFVLEIFDQWFWCY